MTWKCLFSPSWYAKYKFYNDGEIIFEIRRREDARQICNALKIELPEGTDK